MFILAACNFSCPTSIQNGGQNRKSDSFLMNRLSVLTLIVASLSLTVFLFPRSAPSPSTLRSSGPIVVELFTSEGCSSCPPADALLRRFDQQPYSGTQLIVLSEHVDYWNHIGWRDPYSDAAFSERQEAYGAKLGLESVYTPQMIVDGTREFAGSSSSDAFQAFEKASAATKVPVRISAVSAEGNLLKAHVQTAELPTSSAVADVVVAVAFDHAESQVNAGENSGRKLTHVAVVRSLSRVGALAPGQSFARDVEIKLEPHAGHSALRIIAFVQQQGPGRIVGAAEEIFGK